MKTDLQLTKHFHLSEFTTSATAKQQGIDNTPSIEVIENLQHLCQEILEPLREYFNEPIVISSGYRCPALNKAVHGTTNSNHLYGYAADIRLPTKLAPNPSSGSIQDLERGREYLHYILNNLKFDELIWEHSSHQSSSKQAGSVQVPDYYWIHVAIRRNAPNRQRYVPLHLHQA